MARTKQRRTKTKRSKKVEAAHDRPNDGGSGLSLKVESEAASREASDRVR